MREARQLELGLGGGQAASPPRPPPLPARHAWYQRLPRRARVALWALLVGWLGLGVALFGGWARPGTGGRAPRPAGPRSDLVLWVVTPQGAPPALALLHRGPRGSEVVLLPAGTVVEVPGEGPDALGGALARLGAEGVAVAVANALGVRVPATVAGDGAGLRALVDAVGGVEVDVPGPVELEEGGVRRQLVAGGRRRLDGAGFLQLFTAALPEESELERVARQLAAWRGLLAGVARAGDLAPAARVLEGFGGDLGGEEAAGLLRAVGRDRGLAFLVLPVRRAGVSAAGLYQLETSELGPLRQALADVTVVRSPAGRRVRLLVGTEDPVGPAVARRLVEAGYVIVLTGRAARPYEETRVVIAEDTPELRRTARALVELLGTGRVGLARIPQTLVDVTLVVGRDWARRLAGSGSVPSR